MFCVYVCVCLSQNTYSQAQAIHMPTGSHARKRLLDLVPIPCLTDVGLDKTVLASADCAMEGGAGMMQQVQQGRPDLKKFLQSIQEQHNNALEVPVVFSGVCVCVRARACVYVCACVCFGGGIDTWLSEFMSACW